jgi:hypothetical protein
MSTKRLVYLFLLFALILSVGSVFAQSETLLTANLTGAAEVPGPGDPDGSGTADVTLKPASGEICYEINVSNIASATMAHIHVGAADVAGPVVVNFDPPASGSSSGCVAVDISLINAIIADPANYYVNVHNASFPAGAVRGQLEKVKNTEGSYIQINHSNISVTGTEQPSIVVQLGNRGQHTLEDVGVACGWNQFIRGVNETQNGPFGDPTLILASTSTVFDGFTVFAWDEAVDIPAGQNHNVAFKIRFALPSTSFKGTAGELRCFLTHGPAVDAEASDIFARSSTIPVNIH